MLIKAVGETTQNTLDLDPWLSPQHVKGLYAGWWSEPVLQSHSIHRSTVICGLPLHWTAVVSHICI